MLVASTPDSVPARYNRFMLVLDHFLSLDAIETRGSGHLHIRFQLTAPGVYQYVLKGKQVRALKLPDVWSSEPFRRSAASVPMTLEHPRERVTPATPQHVIGMADSVPAALDGGRVTHGGTLFHQMVIDAIRSKAIKAVSAGTNVDWRHAPGTWLAADGTKHDYDLIQDNPILDHIAATAHPRVPDSVIFDSTDDFAHAVAFPIGLDGFDMDELQKLLAKIPALDSTAVDALKTLLKDRDSQIERLTAERDVLKSDLAKAPSLDSVTSGVTAKLAQIKSLVAKVPSIALDALMAAKDDREMLLCALDALKVGVDRTKGVEYLQAALDLSLARSAPHHNSAREAIRTASNDAQESAHDGLSAAEKAEQRIRAARARDIARSRGVKEEN